MEARFLEVGLTNQERSRGFFNNGGTDDRSFSSLSDINSELTSFLSGFSDCFKTAKSDVSGQAAAYVGGLCQTIKRNIERIDELAPGYQYHQLHHFLAYSPWDDRKLDKAITERAAKVMGKGRVALLFDPTSFAKKGNDSVGVGRQYLGSVGKIDNGQVGVVASLVNGRDACLIDKELYLTKSWPDDNKRCEKAGIPVEARRYRTHQQIVMEMLQRIDEQGIHYDWIGMDAEFGSPVMLLTLDDLDKRFLIDVRCNLSVYPRCPKLTTTPKRFRNQSKKLRFQAKPIEVKQLIDGRRWKCIAVRPTTKGTLKVDIQHRDVWLVDPKTGRQRPFQLVIRRERSDRESNNETHTRIKYSLSNAPRKLGAQELAFMQAQRFWIEHAIKECKQLAGLNEYQVRLWHGWHHHFSLAMLVCLFLTEMRLKYNDPLPLLTGGDIWTMLFNLLPRKTDTREGLLKLIRTRYRKREAALHYAYLKE